MVFCLPVSSHRLMEESGDGQRRQFNLDRVLAALPGDGFGGDAAEVAYVAAAVTLGIGIENFPVEAGTRNANAVASPHHGGRIHGENNILSVGRLAEEGDHAVVRVMEVDPFETVMGIVEFVKGWVFLVDVVEVLD